MATLGFKDNAGVDLGIKYVTKEYVMEWYPDLLPNMITPQLWSWGYNNSGQLGDGTIVNKSSPVTTAGGGTNWKQVAGGYFHTAAIKTDGTLWTWGYNSSGQLGDNTTVNKSRPVTTAGGGTNWKQVAGGSYHTAAIKTDGTLWTWGYNGYGQLGDGTNVNKSSPVTTAGGGTNWKQVSSGDYHTAAIKTDGTLWTCGYNSYGRLGDGTTANKNSPVTTAGGGTNWKQVSAGYWHTAAIKTDGTLWTWGRCNYGQLGDGTTANKNSPVTTAGGGTNWKQVAGGAVHTAAIKTDGTLWTCGYNRYGQLGDGTIVNKSSPVTTAGGGTNWKQVAGGYFHTAAIKTDGTLWTWGYNNNGGLGDGTIVDKLSPVTTAGGGTNWKQVSSGSYHTAAISESEGW
jgi:alpha-tubulin suppressor-like RCC1 family protein